MDYTEVSEWEQLGNVQKEETMRRLLEKLPGGFVFEGVKTFGRWGQSLETGVFVFEGRSFVFVPGRIVNLGWAGGEKRLDAVLKKELLESLEMHEITDAEAFLHDMSSPARTVRIGALLVECQTRQAGWRELGAEEIRSDPKLIEDIGQFERSGYSGVTLNQSLKMEREEGRVRVYRFVPGGLNEWAKEWMFEGFRLPNEDEWEYLYGGGSESIFPWGDRFDYGMKLRHLEKTDEASAVKPYDLEQENAFGLFFAGDPYVYELTSESSAEGVLLRGKGGDGGSLICGGEEALLGYLPATMIAYRDSLASDPPKSWKELAPYSVYRRILDVSGYLTNEAKKEQNNG